MPCQINDLPLNPGEVKIEHEGYLTKFIPLFSNEFMWKAHRDLRIELVAIPKAPTPPSSGPCAETLEDRKRVGHRKAKLCLKPELERVDYAEYGYCEIKFIVSEMGKPRHIVLESCSDAKLIDPALNFIQGHRYLPALYFGRPIESALFKARVEFNIGKLKGNSVRETEDLKKIDQGVNACGERFADYAKFGDRPMSICESRNRHLIQKYDGECDVKFEISKLGYPENLTIQWCTENRLRPLTHQIIFGQRYRPALYDGYPIGKEMNETVYFKASRRVQKSTQNGRSSSAQWSTRSSGWDKDIAEDGGISDSEAYVKDCPKIDISSYYGSGYCEFTFDIYINGLVEIHTATCSDDRVVPKAKLAMMDCLAYPAVRRGRPIISENIEHRLDY